MQQYNTMGTSPGRCFCKARSPATFLAMGPAEIWSLPLSRSRTGQCSLEELGRTWKNLEELGRTWKNLEEHETTWEKLGQFGISWNLCLENKVPRCTKNLRTFLWSLAAFESGHPAVNCSKTARFTGSTGFHSVPRICFSLPEQISSDQLC